MDPEKYKVKKNCRKIFSKNNNEGRFNAIIETKQYHSVNHSMQQEQRNLQSAETCQKSANNLHNSCRKYIVSSLVNRTNLIRWKMSENNNNNNCKLALDRCKWRPNSVISTICNHLKTKLTNDLLQLYADIEGYVNPATLFKRCYQAFTTNMDDNL